MNAELMLVDVIDAEEVALAGGLHIGDRVELLSHCDEDGRPGDVANILHIDAKTGNVTFYVHRTDTVTSHFPSALVLVRPALAAA